VRSRVGLGLRETKGLKPNVKCSLFLSLLLAIFIYFYLFSFFGPFSDKPVLLRFILKRRAHKMKKSELGRKEEKKQFFTFL